MLYIKKLVVVNENDEIILRLNHTKALEGATTLLKVINDKGGIKQRLKELDEEFKDYFNFGKYEKNT